MKSVVKFYYVPFNDGENKLIEDIDAFLSRTSADAVESEHASYLGTITDFQFVKNDIELTIKIESGQLEAPIFNANYLSVANWNDTLPTSPTARIQKTYYYFIKEIKSKAEDTLELTLKMDTLNTLGVDLIDTNNWLDATLVEREHRDRFFDGDDLPHTTSINAYAKRVDEIPEGIQFPLYKDLKGVFNDTFNSKFYLVYRSSFAIDGVDATNSDIQSKNAVRCFLLAESGKHIPMMNYYGASIDISSKDDVFAELTSYGDCIIFDSDDNPELLMQIGKYRSDPDNDWLYASTNFAQARKGKWKAIFGMRKANNSTQWFHFVLLFKEDGTSSYTEFTHSDTPTPTWWSGVARHSKYEVEDSRNQQYYDDNTGLLILTHSSSRANSKDFTIQKARIGRFYSFGSSAWTSYAIPAELQTWSAWQTLKPNTTQKVYAEGIGIDDMMTIDEIDRTDSRLIKIIELPYAPNAPEAHGSGVNLYYTFGNNWSSSADIDDDNLDMVRAFQLVGDLEPDFSHALSSKYTISGVQVVGTSATYLKPWSSTYETKLNHSDYQKHCFVYDNFSMELKEEMLWRINYWADGQTAPATNYLSFDIVFTASSNLTSGNLFQLHCIWDGDDVAEEYYKSEEIYPLTLVAIRNNELNLYNASYLNYIRAGYNYDIKAKSIQQRMGFLSAEQGRTNALIGAVNAIGSGSPAGIVHAITGVFGAFYNYDVAMRQVALQQQLAQNQIDKTLAQTAIQGTSVAGADNLSLFNKYSGNKLLRVEMSILPVYKQKVAQLFHFFGYATQKYKIPNFTGRCFFNYVKCQPVLKDLPKTIAIQNSALMPYRYHGFSEKIFKDAISKFSNGVFIIHKFAPNEVIGNTKNTWNISMDKENWENFILTELELPEPELEE